MRKKENEFMQRSELEHIIEFIQELIRHEMIRKEIMLTRLAGAELQDAERSRIGSKIEAMFSN